MNQYDIRDFAGDDLTTERRWLLKETLNYARAEGETLRDPGNVDELLGKIARGVAVGAVISQEDKVFGVAVIEAAGVTKKRPITLEIVALVGLNMALWIDEFDEYVEELAQRVGASNIGVRGRPGWQRKLTSRGFHTESVYMARAVE